MPAECVPFHSMELPDQADSFSNVQTDARMSQVSSKHFIRAKFCVFSFLSQQLLMRNFLSGRILFKVPRHSQLSIAKRDREWEIQSGNSEKIN